MFPPLTLKTVRWRSLEGQGLEHLTIGPINGTGSIIRAGSVVIGERGGCSYGVRYRIECDERWHVRSVFIETTQGVTLSLSSDGKGHWRDSDGTPLPAFDGCLDVDLAGTPFTNTLPIRRLALTPDTPTAILSMLYIPFDTFQPLVDGQLYTCLREGALYRYEAEDRSFTADLPVDEDGLVTDYPTLFQRL